MGKFNLGILGHVNGKVGTVVGSRWRGVDYVKAKSRRSTKPPTLKQLMQRARFSVMSRFLFSFSELLMESFNDPSEEMTGINRAFKYNVKHALTGTYPDFMVDYPKVALSQGVLHNVVLPQASAGSSGRVKFTWTVNTGPNTNEDDVCVGVIYCPETNQAIYRDNGAGRSSGSEELDAALFSGKLVHTWILFAAADGSAVSSSVYTGTVSVS